MRTLFPAASAFLVVALISSSQLRRVVATYQKSASDVATSATMRAARVKRHRPSAAWRIEMRNTLQIEKNCPLLL